MFTTPNPLHFSQTSFTRAIVVARRTHIFGHYGGRLQSVCQNNVRIHRGDVQVINQRVHFDVRIVAKVFQLFGNLRSNFIIVLAVVSAQWLFGFVLESVVEIFIELVQKSLISLWIEREVTRNV